MTNGEELRIRLHLVDTPERGEPCFDQATERFRELEDVAQEGGITIELATRL